MNIAKPEVFVGGLLGAMLVFLFSALAIRAVGKAAFFVINEVRRQFKADPGILAGTSRPDYGRCVDIVTIGALKEMVAPGVLAVGMPIAVGVVFKIVSRRRGGGGRTADGRHHRRHPDGPVPEQQRRRLGQRQEVHREPGCTAANAPMRTRPPWCGDTVGDPFKDTAGPSIHVLIKLLSTITLVMAPLFI